MKIAVYYHTKMIGPEIGINPAFSRWLLSHQMRLMQLSGLTDAASDLVMGFNDTPETIESVKKMIPEKARILSHGLSARSEIPTLKALQRWLPGHEDYYVCYWHGKGISHPYDALCEAWRRCMQNAVIRNWRRCVSDLDNGCDSVGVHWLTREEFGPMVTTFFWGGNFWWAKASFLAKLPQLPEDSTNRHIAEGWIGEGPRPVVRDYAHHWPNTPQCGASNPCFMVNPQ